MDDKQRLEVGAFLRQGEWFGGLPDALQRRLLAVAVMRSWPKGHTIQVEDAPVPAWWRCSPARWRWFATSATTNPR